MKIRFTPVGIVLFVGFLYLGYVNFSVHPNPWMLLTFLTWTAIIVESFFQGILAVKQLQYQEMISSMVDRLEAISMENSLLKSMIVKQGVIQNEQDGPVKLGNPGENRSVSD